MTVEPMDSPRKMKVLLDVALLGEAHRAKAHARGVHRVAERIVSGLALADECDLRFVATSHLAAAFRALQARGLSPETRLMYRPAHMILSHWAERAFDWVGRTLPNRKIHLRAARWLLQRFAVWANSRARDIPSSALRDIDIYHSPLGPIPEIVRANREIKQFLTVVDVIPLTNPESVAGRGVPLLKRQLDSVASDQYVFAISETVKSELLQIKDLPQDHVLITPLAASAQLFHPVSSKDEIARVLQSHGLPQAPYFLALSSFDPRKNFGHVIRCFCKLLERPGHSEVHLVIVGSNPERNAFVDQALADAVGVTDRIHTPGYIPDEHLAALYSGALAFLFPSLAEGFGMPVLEAMSCGTPVISSAAPALPEIVGDAGILLDPRDQTGWIEAMARIENSADLRSALTRAGLRRAAEFSWERFTKATLDGYRESLSVNAK